jgi:hypothetical protein
MDQLYVRIAELEHQNAELSEACMILMAAHQALKDMLAELVGDFEPDSGTVN